MAWQLTVGADLALPQVNGPRPLPVRVINAYVSRVLLAAERDPAVAEQFLRVIALHDPPKRVFRPSTALRVLLGHLRSRAPRSRPPQGCQPAPRAAERNQTVQDTARKPPQARAWRNTERGTPALQRAAAARRHKRGPTRTRPVTPRPEATQNGKLCARSPARTAQLLAARIRGYAVRPAGSSRRECAFGPGQHGRWYTGATSGPGAQRRRRWNVYRVSRCLAPCQPVSPVGRGVPHRPPFGHMPGHAKGPLPGGKGP